MKSEIRWSGASVSPAGQRLALSMSPLWSLWSPHEHDPPPLPLCWMHAILLYTVLCSGNIRSSRLEATMQSMKDSISLTVLYTTLSPRSFRVESARRTQVINLQAQVWTLPRQCNGEGSGFLFPQPTGERSPSPRHQRAMTQARRGPQWKTYT